MVQALPDEVPEPGGSGSSTVTAKPFFRSHSAQDRPTMPAPTTATSGVVFNRYTARVMHQAASLGYRDERV